MMEQKGCIHNYIYVATVGISHVDLQVLSRSIFQLRTHNIIIILIMYSAVTLSGNNGELFKGFLVQARLAADGTSLIGSFGVLDDSNSKHSDCTPNKVRGGGNDNSHCIVMAKSS